MATKEKAQGRSERRTGFAHGRAATLAAASAVLLLAAGSGSSSAEGSTPAPSEGQALVIRGLTPTSPPLMARSFTLPGYPDDMGSPKADWLYPVLALPAADYDRSYQLESELNGTDFDYAFGPASPAGPVSASIDGGIVRAYFSGIPLPAPGEFSLQWRDAKSGEVVKSGSYAVSGETALRFVGPALHPTGRPVTRLAGLRWVGGTLHARFEAPWSALDKEYAIAADGSPVFRSESDTQALATEETAAGTWSLVATAYETYVIERIAPDGGRQRIERVADYPRDLSWRYRDWPVDGGSAPRLGPGAGSALVLGASLFAREETRLVPYAIDEGTKRLARKEAVELGSPVSCIAKSGSTLLAALADGSLVALAGGAEGRLREVGRARPAEGAGFLAPYWAAPQAFMATAPDRAWVAYPEVNGQGYLFVFALGPGGRPSFEGRRDLPSVRTTAARSAGEGVALPTRPFSGPERDELWLPTASGALGLSAFACPEGYSIRFVRKGRVYALPDENISRPGRSGPKRPGGLAVFDLASGSELAAESPSLAATLAKAFPGLELSTWSTFAGREILAVLVSKEGAYTIVSLDLDSKSVTGSAAIGALRNGVPSFFLADGLAIATGGLGAWDLRTGRPFDPAGGDRESRPLYGRLEPLGADAADFIVKAPRISAEGTEDRKAMVLLRMDRGGLRELGSGPAEDYYSGSLLWSETLGRGVVGLLDRYGSPRLFFQRPEARLRVSPLHETWSGIAGGFLHLQPGPGPWLFLSYAAAK